MKRDTGMVLPLHASPSALRQVVRRAFDPDDLLQSRAEELAREGFDERDERVIKWLSHADRAAEMLSYGLAALCDNEDDMHATEDRLRDWYAVDMACDYILDAEDELAREADERDEDYALTCADISNEGRA